jgi:hypothetical protein
MGSRSRGSEPMILTRDRCGHAGKVPIKIPLFPVSPAQISANGFGVISDWRFRREKKYRRVPLKSNHAFSTMSIFSCWIK